MRNKYPLYPDDMSNQYGKANSLGTSGGVFDAVEESSPPLPPVVPERTDPVRDDTPKTYERRFNPVIEPVKRHVDEPVMLPEEEKPGGRLKLVVPLLLMMAAAAFVILFLNTHIMLGELFGKHDILSTHATAVDLSGSDYADYTALSRLKSLETIDLTNSSFSELSCLYGCERLKTVRMADRELSAEECIGFYRNMPEARLICRVKLGGRTYDSKLTQLISEKVDTATQVLYPALRNLRYLDLRTCDVSDDTFKTLTRALPDCLVIMRVTICGREYTTDSETVMFEGEITEGEANRAGYFKKLKSIDIQKCANPEILNDYLAAHPDVRLVRSVDLLGRKFGSEDELIDLRGEQYTFSQVRAALDDFLPKMKTVKKIDMCGCGLSDEEMEALCAAYPSVKFVWMIHFAKWDVRTDAVAFSALNRSGFARYSQKDYAPLFRYCTDLRALDLKHSMITDISGISSLKKLRAVVLTNNRIKDISAFAELKELEYIEMNATNRVKSLEPLRALQTIRFINMWGSVGISDLSPLYDHEKLEIAIFERTLPRDEQKRFIRSNPDCKTFFEVDSFTITTNQTWRSNPYRIKLMKAFSRKNEDGSESAAWEYVVGFNEETGDFIFDYKTDQYAVK